MKPFRQIKLANGLMVCFHNQTRRYFGDYHQIKVELSCQVPLMEEYFKNREEWENAVKILGNSANFRRCVEQMGVSSAEIESSLEATIENFCKHSLHYLASPEFPRRVVQTELAKSRTSVSRRYQD